VENVRNFEDIFLIFLVFNRPAWVKCEKIRPIVNIL